MTTMPKTFLAVSAAGFVSGSIIDFGGFNLNPSWTVALPLGAVFFGLFLISLMMEKEMAKFDGDETEKLRRAGLGAATVAPKPEGKPIQNQSAPRVACRSSV